MGTNRDHLIEWANEHAACPDHSEVASAILAEFGATADTEPPPPAGLLTPGTASLFDILVDAGLNPMDERVDGRPFPHTPVSICLHHTATGYLSKDMPTLNIIKRGLPRLPGPLASILIGRSGSVAVTTDGYSNNCGGGRARVLSSLRAGRELSPEDMSGPDGASFNRFTYGIEVENNGTGEPYKLECLRSIQRVCAALCKAFGWNEHRVFGHKESTGRKPDPTYSMPEMRDQIGMLVRRTG